MAFRCTSVRSFRQPKLTIEVFVNNIVTPWFEDVAIFIVLLPAVTTKMTIIFEVAVEVWVYLPNFTPMENTLGKYSVWYNTAM